MIDVLPSWRGVARLQGHRQGLQRPRRGLGRLQSVGAGQPSDTAVQPRTSLCTHALEVDEGPHLPRPRLAASALACRAPGSRRLAFASGDWFIEEWGGTTVLVAQGTRAATDFSAARARALRSSPPHLPPHSHLARRAQLVARFLAQIHAVPPGWYEPFREQLKPKHPALAAVPDGCHVWWFSARDEWMGDWSPSTMAAFAALGAPRPPRRPARRLVTVHGDYHAGNIIRATDTAARELRAIDLEFASANLAVFDIACAIVACGIRAPRRSAASAPRTSRSRDGRDGVARAGR